MQQVGRLVELPAPLLEIEGITKKFGELVALDNVNIKVQEKECLGIIGPNGAGKTTLFNVITGFLKPNSGKVIYMGQNIIGKKPHQLVRLGLVRTFQLIKTFKDLTVMENIVAVNEEETDILKEMGLWEKRNVLAKNLSQGEKRKLNIAMSMAAKPKILLLDEPFAGLSPKEGEELYSIIKKLRDEGLTQVIIEHKLRELFKLSERVTVLNYGKVICEGTPEEVVKAKQVIEAYLGA